MNTEQFSKWCDIELHNELVKTNLLGSAACGEVREQVEDYAKNIFLEITLNPSNTKDFKSTEIDYLKLYLKILNYLKNKPLLLILHDEYEFELCKSGKRHFHAVIEIQPCASYSDYGIIEEMSRFLCKLLRRTYKESCVSRRWPRYRDIPFCINLTHENETIVTENFKGPRSQYWENYIKKTRV